MSEERIEIQIGKNFISKNFNRNPKREQGYYLRNLRELVKT